MLQYRSFGCDCRSFACLAGADRLISGILCHGGRGAAFVTALCCNRVTLPWSRGHGASVVKSAFYSPARLRQLGPTEPLIERQCLSASVRLIHSMAAFRALYMLTC